ncbi:MAG: AAA family ATPase [Gemmataceae bacterium]|nr:AAA family ATPase [Gemmata sp.]MDW8196343.1 AAA family ATPase [Gemmataceae bacterium]
MDWSRFGLDRVPFRSAVDTGGYFPSPVHEAALATVAAAFSRRQPLVLLDGPSGVGKSLVARKWLADLLPEVPRIVIPNATAERPADLFQAILFDLGQSYQGLSEQELRLAVTGHLLEATQTGFPTVLVLDEAQHLSVAALEEVRLFSNLETRDGTAVVTLLIAQPSLRKILARPTVRLFADRLCARITLEPLTFDQSAAYIRHHISVAGGVPSRWFTDEAIALLAAACGGIPRILNRVATVACALSAEVNTLPVDAEAVVEALTQLGLPLPPEEPGNKADEVVLPHPAQQVAVSPAQTQERHSRHRKAKRNSRAA